MRLSTTTEHAIVRVSWWQRLGRWIVSMLRRGLCDPPIEVRRHGRAMGETRWDEY